MIMDVEEDKRQQRISNNEFRTRNIEVRRVGGKYVTGRTCQVGVEGAGFCAKICIFGGWEIKSACCN